MKILHVINSLAPAGAERLVVDLAIAQSRKGQQVQVLLYNATPTPLTHELEAAGIGIVEGRWGREYHPLNVFVGRRAMREADVIHVHLFPAQYWAAAAHRLFGLKAAIVTTEHNTWNARCRYRLTTWTDRAAYRQYDAASCISPAVVDFMKARTKGRLPLRLIENGINVARFSHVRTSRSEVLPEIPEEVFLLVQVAQFREQKNQDCLLRALARMPEDVHAAFAGSGERLEACRELAEKLGISERAHFLGSRSDVPELLAVADLVVMSSHWEGFGLAAAEGMAAGKPVLASRVDGLAQVVGNDELLFNPDDDLELSEKVLLLRANSASRERLANYCRARAEAYSVDRMAENFIKFYEDTIKQAHKR